MCAPSGSRLTAGRAGEAEKNLVQKTVMPWLCATRVLECGEGTREPVPAAGPRAGAAAHEVGVEVSTLASGRLVGTTLRRASEPEPEPETRPTPTRGGGREADADGGGTCCCCCCRMLDQTCDFESSGASGGGRRRTSLGSSEDASSNSSWSSTWCRSRLVSTFNGENTTYQIRIEERRQDTYRASGQKTRSCDESAADWRLAAERDARQKVPGENCAVGFGDLRLKVRDEQSNQCVLLTMGFQD